MRRPARRGRTASRKLDLTAMRTALADGRVHSALGIVTTDGASHYELVDGDLLVDVVLVPSETLITARMALAGGGGAGQGLWWVPDVGSEVALLIPDGELEAGALIVGVLSSAGVPDGIGPGRLLAAWPEVHIVTDDLRLGSADAAQPFVLGDARKSLEDAFLATFATFAATIVTAPVGGGSGFASAVTAFKDALATTLSTKVKGE